MTVRNIMTPNPIWVEATSSISAALAIFQRTGLRHLLVSHQGRLVGILSVNDVPNYAKSHQAVADLMTPNPAVVDQNCDVYTARDAMYSSGFGCLPVTSNGQIVGIVTKLDFQSI